jgi:hypothetical protein
VPWLAKKDSPEMKQLQDVLSVLPEIKRLPNWKGLGAAYVEGMKVIRARTEKAKVMADNATKPKASAKPAGEPGPVDKSAASRAAAFSKFQQSGRIDDAARFLDT